MANHTNSKKLKIAVLGAGQRGTTYMEYFQQEADLVEIVAIIEINEIRREIARRDFHVPRVFSSLADFLVEGKIADAVVVATMDRDHYSHAMALLELGYDLLLEKPISPSSSECLQIQKKAEEMKCTVVVCHVLRYTNFFSEIKRQVTSGTLGKLITIEYAEYMGNFHMAHSFVRGNWRNSESSSPIILQKSCHDMDILTWLADSPAKSVSSFGSLTYFNEAHAPKGSAKRCIDCSVSEGCRFNAETVYLPMIGKWRAVDVTDDMTIEGMKKALKDGPYGRCVFRCDNNVCDHQVTSLEFENGVTATFHMSAFSDCIHRRIKVMCEHGTIEGDDSENTLKITKYGSFDEVPTNPQVLELGSFIGRHCGGDYGLVQEFIKILTEKKTTDSKTIPTNNSLTLIQKSVESHLIANAAETSRVSGKMIHMEEYKKTI